MIEEQLKILQENIYLLKNENESLKEDLKICQDICLQCEKMIKESRAFLSSENFDMFKSSIVRQLKNSITNIEIKMDKREKKYSKMLSLFQNSNYLRILDVRTSRILNIIKTINTSKFEYEEGRE